MRNYNAHHPRGVVSIIGLGLIFSLELLIAPQPVTKRKGAVLGMATATVFCLFCCASWLALDAFTNREFNSLFVLIAQNTPRQSLIVVTDNLTPDGQMKPEAISNMMDRKFLSAGDWESNRNDMAWSGKEVFFLTHGTAPPGSRLVAKSQCPPQWTDRLVIPLFDFYSNKISHRAPEDHTVLFTQYQLYQN